MQVTSEIYHSKALHNKYVHPFNIRSKLVSVPFLFYTSPRTPPLLETVIQKKIHFSDIDSLVNQRNNSTSFSLTLPSTIEVVYIRNYRIILFFVADDSNEYQMARASKKSIELQTAYVYRKNTPRRHHYSGGEMKVAVINVCSLADSSV